LTDYLEIGVGGSIEFSSNFVAPGGTLKLSGGNFRTTTLATISNKTITIKGSEDPNNPTFYMGPLLFTNVTAETSLENITFADSILDTFIGSIIQVNNL
jgi:hypothetical protein